MAQRTAKKDLSTRFYIQIADTLRVSALLLHIWQLKHLIPFAWCKFWGQKFSFDFYNPMVVQKCIATTQALLNDRDVASCIIFAMFWLDCIMIMEHWLSVDVLQTCCQHFLRDMVDKACKPVWGNGRWCWCWEDRLYHDSVPTSARNGAFRIWCLSEKQPRLEAAEDFPDDFGRPLFPRVKLLRSWAQTNLRTAEDVWYWMIFFRFLWKNMWCFFDTKQINNMFSKVNMHCHVSRVGHPFIHSFVHLFSSFAH